MKKAERFLPEEWRITEQEYCKDVLEEYASIFFTGNGYLGMRGGLAEAIGCIGNSHKGTFINGFYESSPQVYGEAAFGFPEERQAMLNLPDLTEVGLWLDDEQFCLDRGVVREYRRSLLMDEGLLSRELVWESPEGRLIRLESLRCISFDRPHLALLRFCISNISNTKRLRLVSSCHMSAVSHRNLKSDPRTGAGFVHDPLQTIDRRIDGDRLYIHQQTARSGLHLGSGVAHVPFSGFKHVDTVPGLERIDFVYEVETNRGQTFEFDKYISYFSSIETDWPDRQIPLSLIRGELSRAESDGGQLIIEEQRSHLARFWEAADVVIEGDPLLQQGIRYNLFALYQSAGRDGMRNTAAKGLSGEGYEGHYFWDTEIFVIPFFARTFPIIARKLLEYRFNILGHARARAEVLSEKGALYPWRTINGVEASAYFPAGTAQYHINADIAYGIQKYVEASGDEDALQEFGAEILVETSRLWTSLGFFTDDGEFRINCVTGPDEYTAMVNNNYFTNIMAAGNLKYACEVIAKLRSADPVWYADFASRLKIADGEPELWLKASEEMYLPYDSSLCVHAQDDSFMRKQRWDFSTTPEERYPLLLNYHPLVIYRHQVLKQPDVVLANFLQGGRFTRIQKIRDFDYYNPITTGDSSLAPCIQSIMAAELDRLDDAYNYFMKTARMDLDDINSNVADGVHIASMGGTWLSLVYGFAGFRDNGGVLSFSPRLPASWKSLSFRLRIRNMILSVKIDHDLTEYSIAGAESGGACRLEIRHRGTMVTVESGIPAGVSMKRELKAVIFDLDGVVTDTSEFHYRAWKRLADEHGYVFSREMNEKLRGIGRLESLDIILEQSGISLSAQERFEQGELKNSYYKELLKTIRPENVLPGIHSLLKELRAAGIKTALASASRNAPEVIERLGMSGDFDLIMDAAAVERGKPDPEIFVSAAEKLSVEEADCAGIEDAAAGIEAIRSAGMFSVGVGPSAEAADWAVGATEELTVSRLVQEFGRR